MLGGSGGTRAATGVSTASPVDGDTETQGAEQDASHIMPEQPSAAIATGAATRSISSTIMINLRISDALSHGRATAASWSPTLPSRLNQPRRRGCSISAIAGPRNNRRRRQKDYVTRIPLSPTGNPPKPPPSPRVCSFIRERNCRTYWSSSGFGRFSRSSPPRGDGRAH